MQHMACLPQQTSPYNMKCQTFSYKKANSHKNPWILIYRLPSLQLLKFWGHNISNMWARTLILWMSAINSKNNETNDITMLESKHGF